MSSTDTTLPITSPIISPSPIIAPSPIINGSPTTNASPIINTLSIVNRSPITNASPPINTLPVTPFNHDVQGAESEDADVDEETEEYHDLVDRVATVLDAVNFDW